VTVSVSTDHQAALALLEQAGFNSVRTLLTLRLPISQ